MSGNLIFIDTSGFFALLDQDDQFHVAAVNKWRSLYEKKTELITTNYIRLESWALLQRRLGLKAVQSFQDDLLPICTLHDIDEDAFQIAVAQWRIASRKNLSIVDLTSFECMRKHHIQEALTFDHHFVEQGFTVTVQH